MSDWSEIVQCKIDGGYLRFRYKYDHGLELRFDSTTTKYREIEGFVHVDRFPSSLIPVVAKWWRSTSYSESFQLSDFFNPDSEWSDVPIIKMDFSHKIMYFKDKMDFKYPIIFGPALTLLIFIYLGICIGLLAGIGISETNSHRVWVSGFSVVAVFYFFVSMTAAWFRIATDGPAAAGVFHLLFFLFYTVMGYAVSYSLLGLSIGKGTTHSLIDSLYFSIVTWTTLGYGDISPTPESRFVAASQALIGNIFTAVSVGMVFAAIAFKKRKEKK